MAFSYILPAQNSSSDNDTLIVPVISEDELANIAEIYLPYALFSDDASYVLNVAPVPDSDLYSVNGTGVWGNASYTSNLGSAVLSLTIDGIFERYFSLY